MRVVVDADVIAAAALAEAGRTTVATNLLKRATSKLAPSHWHAEVANVVWKANLLGSLGAEEVDPVMRALDRLRIDSISVRTLWRGAVVRAIATRHPVYDTLYVELAARERCPLVTFDRKLQKTFPDVAVSPARLL